MIRLIMIPTLRITALFAFLIGGLHLQPRVDPVKADFGDCGLTCWHNIQPGVSTYADTAALFDALGWVRDTSYCLVLSEHCRDFRWQNPKSPGEWAGVYVAPGHIKVIEIGKPGLTLGDLLLGLGSPDYSSQATFLGLPQSPVSVYRAWWSNIAIEFSPDCPMAFTALLNEQIDTMMLNDTSYAVYIPLANSEYPVVGHDFRKACSS